MTKLEDATAALVGLLPPPKLRVIADAMAKAWVDPKTHAVMSLVETAKAKSALGRFLDALKTSGLDGNAGSLLLKCASHVRSSTENEQRLELAMTGPDSVAVATRRTEQVLLDMIHEAQKEIVLVAFVAQDRPKLISALKEAAAKGAEIKILLEAAKEHGGTLDEDQTAILKRELPEARFHRWNVEGTKFQGGKVHAKVAVVDGRVAFVTSANLTGHAMELNLEAGVLVRGGDIPRDLLRHLGGLLDAGFIDQI